MPNGRKGPRPRRPPWERPGLEAYFERVKRGVYDVPEAEISPTRQPYVFPFSQRTPSFLYDYPGAGMGPGREKAWQWRRMAEGWDKARGWQARLTPQTPGLTLPPPLRGEGLPIEPSLAEGARERWFGAWPGKAMTAPFREFVGREAGWTRQAEREFSPIPLTVGWGGRGGGGWRPWEPSIELGAPSVEGGIHEYAHAWYQPRMEDKTYRDRLVRAVMRLAEEEDPQYQAVAELARDYVYGDPWTGFKGMKDQKPGVGAGPEGRWNDWEMFAGLASGIKGNLSLLPPYLRTFYAGMFRGTSEYEPFGRPYPGHHGGPETQFPPWAAYKRTGKIMTGIMEQMFGGGVRAGPPREPSAPQIAARGLPEDQLARMWKDYQEQPIAGLVFSWVRGRFTDPQEARAAWEKIPEVDRYAAVEWFFDELSPNLRSHPERFGAEQKDWQNVNEFLRYIGIVDTRGRRPRAFWGGEGARRR